MSQHRTKHSIIFTVILAALAMIITLAGCKDDFIYEAEAIPYAEVEVEGEVIFKPLVSTEVQTRASEAAEGEAYNGIKSLYVFFFDSEGVLVNEYSGRVKDKDITFVQSEGSTHDRVTFKKRIQAGKYSVFAVANISAKQESQLLEVTTIRELRDFKLDWDDDIANDLEMFGVFKQLKEDGTAEESVNTDFEADALLSITPSKKKIHSWVRRAASKVTVDFNGSNLFDGVTIYIKKATLKDMADGAFLGKESAISEESGFGFWTLDTETKSENETETKTEYAISYGKDENGLSVTNKADGKNPSPSDAWNGTNLKSFHDDAARALPCYENMQGVHEDKSKLQDKDKDGIIDSYTKDGVPNGTYLEVEGYYKANRPEYKSEGKIIYRFMLGQNAENDFNIMRNHHYKITMNFKDYGNDVDWHIEYAEKYFDVTYPQDVNYKGLFLSPDPNYEDIPNAGHDFRNENAITVTSYVADGAPNPWVAPEITYTYYSYNDQTGEWSVEKVTQKPEDGWLTLTETMPSEDKTQKTYTYEASKSPSESKTINSRFPTSSVAEKENPYNLSNSDGSMTIEETANCYMVGAPGWYCFPLVYGNGITNKVTNSDAFPSAHFVNHLNKPITETTGPYIKDNVDLSYVSVKLIWQDADKLIAQDENKKYEIVYDPYLFEYLDGEETKYYGGIKFHISSIKEGNAVIALVDNSDIENKIYAPNATDAEKAPYKDIDNPNTKAIWSWHIWATRFGFDDFEKDIRILNHDEESYQMMPVNLGWCAGNQPVKYYKRRKCDIKFKVGDNVITRTIEQYPHFVLPRGDHPYYQWGRKDPFVGSNEIWKNKPRWNDATGDEITSNPLRLYNEPGTSISLDKRHTTQECLFMLILNPDKWHNAPRDYKEEDTEDYKSINKSFSDLWSNRGKKTIYDPCPPGYQVGDLGVFTGFTTTGENAKITNSPSHGGLYWYDVLETNMEDNYYQTSGLSENAQVLELYTDTRKIQSITFPVCGYRDYDAKAGVYSYPYKDKTGVTPSSDNGIGFVWTNKATDETNSYHLKFRRDDWDKKGDGWKNRGVEISPKENFFNCNGYAVRPVRSPKKEMK